MAIIDHASLAAAAASYLHRSDLASSIPGFISLAEARLNRRLRLRAMETRVTGTSVAGVIALPTDYREARSLHISVGGGWRRVEYRTPEQAGLYPDSGDPQGFTIIGSNIELVPAPAGNVDYRLVYRGAFTPLADGQNWLILNAPDVYLYATLLEATPFVKGDARLAVWTQLLEAAISDLESDDRAGGLGGNTLGVSFDNPVRLG